MTQQASPAALTAALAAIVGDAAVLTGEQDMAPHLTDWRGRFRGDALCVVRPASREEVAAVVRACIAHRAPILPQGGNTSMSGGSVPFAASVAIPPVIVNLARMRAIRSVDPVNNTIEAEAGCLVAQVQAAAAAVDRLYPVSFGAEGSAQVGGSVATNAGGTGVLRYGNTRENVLGLEVVLPDASTLNLMRTLRKDNSGYDLKQLFIGSEGTLGLITAVALKLHPRPTARAVAWAAPRDVQDALALLAHLQRRCGGQLSAFEILNRAQLEHVLRHVPGVREPLPQPAGWNLLVELSDAASADALRRTLEEALAVAHGEGLLADAAVAQSEAQCEEFWRIRHSVSEGNKQSGMSVVFDIAVPVVRVPAFIGQATAAVNAMVPWARVAVVGHLGDGNIHFVCVFERARWDAMAQQPARLEQVRASVYDVATALGGTWSAEHGIGRTLLQEMARYKSGVELATMRTIKSALDPHGLFNPGKLLPPG